MKINDINWKILEKRESGKQGKASEKNNYVREVSEQLKETAKQNQQLVIIFGKKTRWLKSSKWLKPPAI